MPLTSKYLFVFLILLTFGSLASERDSVELKKNKGDWFIVHIVDQGETLYSLARRYQSNVSEIISENEIENNQISLFQKLLIPVSKEYAKAGKRQSNKADELPEQKKESVELESAEVVIKDFDSTRIHVVKPKETLYSISRIYSVTLDDLRTWNNLESDGLDIGQIIKVTPDNLSSIVIEDVEADSILKVSAKKELSSPKKVVEDQSGFTVYLVQNGDIIESIASKFAVRPDSILHWNKLQNTYLAIGQKLMIKGAIDSLAQTQVIKKTELPYGTRRKIVDQSGFSKVIEEGIALSIDSPMQSEKALVMHRTQAIGSMLEVRNLMNNKKILVKVVGTLPETGLNKNTLIRLTPVGFKRLGVIDSRARVEVTYYE
ncbi:MAG: LysM peptidoglycan-binding domain-containing protein [Cyclobacteriaceae bacterium]